MPLEKALNSQKLNIKEMTLSREKEPILESRKMYERLKDTDFYNRIDDYWKWYVIEGGRREPGQDQCLTDTQFAGVLVEAIFDKNLAYERYVKLKGSILFNTEANQWNRGFRPRVGGDSVDTLQVAFVQLLGVLAKAVFNKVEAKKAYQEYKSSNLFNKDKNYWYVAAGENKYGSLPQLLDIWIEWLFDRESAKKHLEDLKETPLYDASSGQWNSKMGDEGVDYKRFTGEQLVGILVESLFDKKSAWEKYNQLQNTSLYDKDRKRWKSPNTSSYFSLPQLLDILVYHALFEQKEPRVFQQVVPAVPEVRKF